MPYCKLQSHLHNDVSAGIKHVHWLVWLIVCVAKHKRDQRGIVGLYQLCLCRDFAANRHNAGRIRSDSGRQLQNYRQRHVSFGYHTRDDMCGVLADIDNISKRLRQ